MVDELIGPYLQAVDEALPEFVAMLYVVGSLALGAWQPDRSDIDTVIFTSRVPTEEDLAALREVHAAMRGKPDLDGVTFRLTIAGPPTAGWCRTSWAASSTPIGLAVS